MKHTHLNKKGFTLIELLVVVLIISILSGLLLTVINPLGIQKKTRDAQRKSDIKKIQTALELYFADFRAYPVDAGTSFVRISSTGTVNSALTNGYLSKIPEDPGKAKNINTDGFSGDCTDNDFEYAYKSTGDGTKYILAARMEVQTSTKGSNCYDLANRGAVGLTCPNTASTTNSCYGVENP